MSPLKCYVRMIAKDCGVHCGANLNVSPCSCESFVVDPRFAELRALLDEKMIDYPNDCTKEVQIMAVPKRRLSQIAVAIVVVQTGN